MNIKFWLIFISLNQIVINSQAFLPPRILITKCPNRLFGLQLKLLKRKSNKEIQNRLEIIRKNQNEIVWINKWYDDGHIITFFTSRTDETRQITLTWLDKHGFKYHGLLMNKPRGGNYHWIDNHIVRATRFKTKWTQLVKKNSVIEVFDNDLEK